MCRSTGSPRVSHSVKEPVMWTVVVLGLTTRGSGGTPDNDAMALGAGFSKGTGAGTLLWGHVNSLISPQTFTSSLKNRKEGNLLATKMLHNEALVTAGRIIVESKVADLLGFT